MSKHKPKLQAPFSYFGGKMTVAKDVWARFGKVDNYVEPFFGSGAVLLGAPVDSTRTETVNDKCVYVANFWRAVQSDPDRVAALIDWPVNETDLEARHKWLVDVSRKREHTQRMRDDHEYFDAKIAAYWCWGLCAWIGSGWCSDKSEWHGPGSPDNKGVGIAIADREYGGKRPHLKGHGNGIHKTKAPPLVDWMRLLCDRLRRVRVCCGDWKRVITPCVTTGNGVTGVFLDPPYGHGEDVARDTNIYAQESATAAADCREWAIANGNNKLFRIALCGYDGEHKMPDDWECFGWKASAGMASQSSKKTQGKANRLRERIWFSPHCKRTNTLFSGTL